MGGINIRKSKKKLILKIFLSLFLVGVLTCVFLVGALAVYIDRQVGEGVDLSMFSVKNRDTITRFYYYNGAGEAVELTEECIYGAKTSIYKSIEEIPRDLCDAFVAIEDKRFWEHDGVDWYRTLGAGANHFLGFQRRFGASTITQQVVKNITENDEITLERKLREIVLAQRLEDEMDKDEILELYLNIINLSEGCYGVGAAAELYFSKDVSELSLLECATVAAITNNPSYYDPIRFPEHNKYRRDLILGAMHEQGYITDEEYGLAYGADVVLEVNEEAIETKINSWYVDMVIEDVIDSLVEKYGYTEHAAAMLVYNGGLRIYTAMDERVQSTLEKYYERLQNFPLDAEGKRAQSAMIIIDPYDGDILGVAGAVGEKSANRIQNFATQTVRPSGSVIKPLSVYATALEEGIINWATVYDDVPVNFGKYNLDPTKGAIKNPVAWPANANGVYRGLTNINYALKESINTVAVKVLSDVGVSDAFYFLRDTLHMESLVEREFHDDGRVVTDMDVAAMALGQMNYGVSLLEVTAAYSIFADGGEYNSPRSFYEVYDSNGNLILENEHKSNRAISAANASIMTLMMQNVVTDGTAKPITLDRYIDVAGKTGTTQKNYDKWFIGYTPYYIGGVWYGYEYPKEIENSAKNICLQVWDDVMSELHADYLYSEGGDFEYSRGIIRAEYCRDSGKLVTDACRADARGDRSEKGYFVRGTEPREYCDCHVLVGYDVEYGGVADFGCSDESVELVGMISVERSFPKQIYVTDAQYVYKKLREDIMPADDENKPFFANMIPDKTYIGISYGKKQFNRYCKEHFDIVEWIFSQFGE